MAEYFELPKDFQGFVNIDGEKVFVVEIRTACCTMIPVPHIKGVSKGRLLKRGIYDYKMTYDKDYENRWISAFLGINSKGIVNWYFVNAKYEMIDHSDLWTEFVKACREQKCHYDPDSGVALEGFCERVVRTPIEIVKGRKEGNVEYWLNQVFKNKDRSEEEKKALREFIPASVIEYYDRMEHLDALMEKSCEREGSAKFTFGT